MEEGWWRFFREREGIGGVWRIVFSHLFNDEAGLDFHRSIFFLASRSFRGPADAGLKTLCQVGGEFGWEAGTCIGGLGRIAVGDRGGRACSTHRL